MRAEKPGQLEPVLDGWHDTGDIVSIDRDGFITIKGRAKRFAKVGGEMVSLAAVEAMAAECCRMYLSAAATAPDARKGERIILVTQQSRCSDSARLSRTAAKRKGMSELAIPSEIVIVQQISAWVGKDRSRRRCQARQRAVRAGRGCLSMMTSDRSDPKS
ncbi:MAG: hypothetical protein R3D62_16965 [Xanthobacteraceae bacterium]